MAIDKNSNSYTFGFAILMVIVVGSLLAVASQGLKTRQEKNATDKKMMSILSAINICLLYTSPSPRDRQKSRMPSSA